MMRTSMMRTSMIVQRKINILEVLSAVNRGPSISKASTIFPS